MTKCLFFISLISFCYCNANDSEYQEATQKASEAFYVQSGLNVIVDRNVKELEEKLPPYCKKSLAFIVPIVDTIVKQRVELKYEF